MTKKYFLLVLCLCSCFLHADELNHAFDKATTYFKAGEMNHAITYFEEAYQKAPAGLKKDIIAYDLATSYLKNEQFEKAISLFKDVYESRDRHPTYLFERCIFNLTMAELGRVNQVLSNLEASLESLNIAKESLNSAEQVYRLASQSQEGLVHALSDTNIEFSIKGLKSDLHHRIEQEKLKELSVESAIEKLQHQMGSQISCYERLGLKQLEASLRRYFLSQQYSQEKKAKLIWQRLDELVEDQISQLSMDTSKSEKLDEQKALKKQIAQSYNDYLASLDCMKENQLWIGRLKSAKSKLALDLVEHSLKQKDPIEYCLQKRIDIAEKQQEKNLDSSFVGSLHRELKHTSGITSALIEQMVAAIEESSEHKEMLHIVSLAEKLKKQVKNLYSASSLYKDYYVYQQMIKDPMDVIYPVYVKIKSDQKDQKSFYQLQAAYELFDAQKNLSYSEEKMRKVERSCRSLDAASKAFEEKEYEKCVCLLEDFLSHWDFENFVLKELQSLSSEFQPVLQSTRLDSIHLEKISEDLSAVDKLRLQADLSTEDFDLCRKLDPGFKGSLQSMQMQKIAIAESYQKVLVTNAHQWIKRLVKSLENQELASTQILSQAIEEQELALSFSNEYPKLGQEGMNFDNEFLEITIDLENYPIELASSFEPKYYQEIAQEDPGKKIKKDKVIVSFHEGLKCARLAQKELQSKAIDWSKVKEMQEKTIEYWKEALSSYNNSEEQQSDQSSSNSNQGQENPDNVDNSADVSQLNGEPQEGDKDLDAKSQRTIMGILEKLNEMQQDDKIVEKDPQQAKEGLRPW